MSGTAADSAELARGWKPQAAFGTTGCNRPAEDRERFRTLTA
ncbi:MAG: hypothetical protein ACLRP3_17380 [Escherichia sp.]